MRAVLVEAGEAARAAEVRVLQLPPQQARQHRLALRHGHEAEGVRLLLVAGRRPAIREISGLHRNCRLELRAHMAVAGAACDGDVAQASAWLHGVRSCTGQHGHVHRRASRPSAAVQRHRGGTGRRPPLHC